MGPFKCPDCGVWWAGYQHACVKPITWPNTTTYPSTYTVRCTCPLSRGDNYLGRCPIHDAFVSYAG